MLRITVNEGLSTIKGGDQKLGFAFPNDLFIEVLDINTQEDFDAALNELDQYRERRCWLITKEGDETQMSIAQACGFMWLWHGVWYRNNFND